MQITPDQQYLDLCNRIINSGIWVENERTGKNVLTVIDASMEYDCSEGHLPILTTKRTAYKSAIAEMWGYLRGYSNAADFRRLGTKTWDANANAESWQNSEWCAGPDDMGYCYGRVGSKFTNPVPYQPSHGELWFELVNQWDDVVEDLCQGIDNRREIVTFYHPGTMDKACLPPCMHTHTFSILDGTLYLTSYQRSADVPLGVPFNMIQCAWLLMVMAKITGLKPGSVFHKMVNVHIYEDQIDGIMQQLGREPFSHPKLIMRDNIQSWDDLMDEKYGLDEFILGEYHSHGPIKFPFSV